jgi:hypothetical protein
VTWRANVAEDVTIQRIALFDEGVPDALNFSLAAVVLAPVVEGTPQLLVADEVMQ